MDDNSSQSVMSMGIAVILASLLFFTFMSFYMTSKEAYSAEMAYEDLKNDIKIQTLLLELGGIDDTGLQFLDGNDIVEFILKQGSRYKYTIITGITYPITYEISSAVEKEKRLRGENGSVIWTENYLANTVMQYGLNGKFRVETIYEGDDLTAFKFTQYQ